MPDVDKQQLANLGVVYQAGYRIVDGRAVVQLFGRLADGATFEVRDYRQPPHFYVRAEDCPDVVPGGRKRTSNKLTFGGDNVVRIEVPTPPDAPTVRDALQARGVETFEADVRFAMRYLIDRNVRGSCRIIGTPRQGKATTWLYVDPDVQPADCRITPRVLSFDIETTPDTKRLLAISMYGKDVDGTQIDEVVIVDGKGRAMPPGAVAAATEQAAITYFLEKVRAADIDVLTGWNVIDFDLNVLVAICERLRLPFHLGRERRKIRIRAAEGYFGSGSATIPGRVVLDGMDLLRGAFVRMEQYSLDAVAREVLGEGKTLDSNSADKAGEILSRYHDDLPAFAHYARTDARLALEIVERLDLIDLAFARSRLTGMTPDRVAASIASFDFLYLAELHRRGIVAPTVRSGDSRVFAQQGGGEVFEPITGVHENVWVLDFKSLYPSIMRTFNVDPLGFRGRQPPGPAGAAGAKGEAGARDEVVRMHDGSCFARGSAILPDMLNELFPRREAAKAAGDSVASQAIKILMNSFYGVLGTPACRFANPDIANAITSQGRYLLNWSRDWFRDRGFVTLYGDTDSLFVASGLSGTSGPCGISDAIEHAQTLADDFNRELADMLQHTYSVQSKLELEFEKLYTKLFLPSLRGGTGGARKRYAGIRANDGEVEFVGMEVVRRDWTELAKIVQRELYARLFSGAPVEDYLKGIVADLRAGRLDDKLIYRKGLRKRVSDYTVNVPPHVQAAKKSSKPPGRIVAYVITTSGPELADELANPPDREHYLSRQVQPVAEPVLSVLGLNFAQVIGDDRQLGLF